MMNKNSLLSALPAFLIGGLVGAVVMVLFAPQAGRDTRALIVDKSRMVKDRVTDTAGQATHRTGKFVGDLTQQARDTAGNILRRGRLTAEEFKSNIEEEAKSKSIQFGS